MKLKLSETIFVIVITILFVSGAFYWLQVTTPKKPHFVSKPSKEVCGLYNLSYEESCLYKDENGKIYVSFVMPSGQFDSEVPHAKLRAVNNSGVSATVDTAFGIDSVTRDEYNDQVIVKATNRENGRTVGQDQVIYIALQGSPPQIKTVLPEPGFAEHPLQSADWYYIPFKDREPYHPENLVLQHINLDGNLLSTWNFGKQLVKKPNWQKGVIASTQLVGDHEILLSFSGTCILNDPFTVCQRYVLDIEHKKVKAVED